VKEDKVVIEEVKTITPAVVEELSSFVEVVKTENVTEPQTEPEVIKVTPEEIQKIVVEVQQEIKNEEIKG
jgi:hypothetical protein